jgi:hypothetical protein
LVKNPGRVDKFTHATLQSDAVWRLSINDGGIFAPGGTFVDRTLENVVSSSFFNSFMLRESKILYIYWDLKLKVVSEICWDFERSIYLYRERSDGVLIKSINNSGNERYEQHLLSIGDF